MAPEVNEEEGSGGAEPAEVEMTTREDKSVRVRPIEEEEKEEKEVEVEEEMEYDDEDEEMEVVDPSEDVRRVQESGSPAVKQSSGE